jgi:hypothetical protein
MPIKTFLNGYPLPASDLNTYLMNQTVMTFASSTARASGIASPSEGMLTWLEDSNKYQYYTGSAWADLLPDTSSFATLTGTQTLTNKTISGGTLAAGTRETTYITATGFAGYTYYWTTNGAIQYSTGNATANGTVNIASTSGQSLNTLLATGDTITATLMITNNTTAYYPTAWQIDGTSVTPKWLGGTAPTAGNTSAIDVYSLVITKTGSATYTVLASQTKFA